MMRRFATLVIAATMLPVYGASPDAPGFSIELPSGLDLALPGFSENKLRQDVPRRPAVLAVSRLSTCYYIRQLNKNLQKPKDKAEFVPLAADESVQPEPGSRLDCLTRSLQPG